jgi:hypothetical protein
LVEVEHCSRVFFKAPDFSFTSTLFQAPDLGDISFKGESLSQTDFKKPKPK